jgi:hypothetical protein
MLLYLKYNRKIVFSYLVISSLDIWMYLYYGYLLGLGFHDIIYVKERVGHFLKIIGKTFKMG